MALIEYTENDHPQNWQGIRIVVNGANGIYQQKYFSYFNAKTKKLFPKSKILKIKKEAEKIHKKWMLEAQIDKELKNKIFTWKFYIERKANRQPSAKIYIGFDKQIDGKRLSHNATLNGTLTTFDDSWQKVLSKYREKCNPPVEKIEQIEASKPSFKELNNARLAFNRSSEIKFTAKQLRACFPES